MHYFSALLGKELYMFRTDLLSIIRSPNTVLTANGICHASYVDCLLADSQHNIPFVVNTVLRLLMMDSKSVPNIYSSLPNQAEKYCISLAFIVRIYHDTRSSDCQISLSLSLSVVNL
jgi:hypothetical protein